MNSPKLNQFEQGKHIRMPEDIKVAEPMVAPEEMFKRAKAETDRFVGTNKDFFAANLGKYGQISDLIEGSFVSAARNGVHDNFLRSTCLETDLARNENRPYHERLIPHTKTVEKHVQILYSKHQRTDEETFLLNRLLELRSVLYNLGSVNQRFREWDLNKLNLLMEKDSPLATFVNSQILCRTQSRLLSIPRFFHNERFEVGTPLLVYRPYSVRYREREIMAKDLCSGECLIGETHPHPELNGFASLQNMASEGHPIPRAIGILRAFEKYSSGAKDSSQVVFKEPLHEPDGEFWYFPVWEVPVKSFRAVRSTYEVEYRRGRHKKTVQRSKLNAQFQSRGAVFFDAFGGEMVERFLNDSYFDSQDRSSSTPKVSSQLVSSEERKIKWFDGETILLPLYAAGFGVVVFAIAAIPVIMIGIANSASKKSFLPDWGSVALCYAWLSLPVIGLVLGVAQAIRKTIKDYLR